MPVVVSHISTSLIQYSDAKRADTPISSRTTKTRKILPSGMTPDRFSLYLRFNKTCTVETFTALVFPEMTNSKHLWRSRNNRRGMYSKSNVLILSATGYLGFLSLSKGLMLKWEAKQDLFLSSSSYFLSRGLEGLLHSGVFTEVTGLLYKQFTWKPSHRECLMKCS